MKKFILYFAIIFILMFTSSCSSSDTSLTPDKICFDNTYITYNEKAPSVIYNNNVEVTSIYSTVYDNNKNVILSTDSQNIIRRITITDNSANTYKDIKVGDSVSDIKSKFKHADIHKDYCAVAFRDNKPIPMPSSSDDVQNNDILIIYSLSNDKITKIEIYDGLYAVYLK